MSNNIRTKNLIYGFSKYDELPYQSSKMIDYSVNNHHLDMVNLNNTYSQCVDNDAFVAKKLISKLDGSSMPGPKVMQDSNDIYQAPDGTKMFMSSGDASIMQKKVLSFQESLTRCGSTSFDDVRFIQKISSQTAFICTSQKTYAVSAEDIGSSKTFVPSNIVKDEFGHDFVVTAVVSSGKLQNSLFAGNPVGQECSLYSLDLTSSGTYVFKQVIDVTFDQPITSISVDDSSFRVMFATQNVIYMCKMKNGSTSDFRSLCTFSSAAGTGDICAVYARDSDVLVFTTTGSLYKVSFLQQYTGFSEAYMSQISLDELIIYDVKKSKGMTFAATNFGICTFSGGNVSFIDASYQNPVHSLYVDSSGTVWGGDDQGQILMTFSGMSLMKYADVQLDGNPVKINSINIINDVKILATDVGLMYEHTNGNFIKISSLNNILSANVIANISNNPADMMLIGSLSDKLVSRRITLDVNVGQENFSIIEGLSSLSDFSDDDYNAEIAGMYYVENERYAFINYSSKSSASNVKSFMLNLDTRYSSMLAENSIVYGVIERPMSNDAYVFMSDSNVIKLSISSESLVKQNIINPIEGYKIIDSQIVDLSTAAVTLSGDEFEIASLVFNEVNDTIEIQNMGSINIGTSSNVIKFNDELLAFNSLSGDSMLSAFNFAHQMQRQVFENSGQFPGKTAELVDEYGMPGTQVFNNLSYRVQNSLLYRRSDYIFNESRNVSAVQSFIIVDKNSDGNVDMQCQKISEIDSTSGITSFDQEYDLSSSTGTCYISAGNAVYTFQPSMLSSKVFDPFMPFTGPKLVNQDVIQCIIDEVEFNYVEQSASMTSYEICSDFTLNKVQCSMPDPESVINVFQQKIELSNSFTDEISNSVPLMLCKAFGSSYVLLSVQVDLENIYTVAQIDDESLCMLTSFSNDGIPQSFIMSYDNSTDQITAYLSDDAESIQYIDIPYESFDDYAAALDNPQSPYSYESVHETVCTSPAGCIHVVFSRSETTIEISSDGTINSIRSTEWIDKDADYAITFNQTASTIENALFTYNMTGSLIFTPQILFKLSADSHLSWLDKNLTLYGHDVDSAFSNIDFISKDIHLRCTLIAQQNSLSAFDEIDNDSMMFNVQLPDGSSNVAVMQCYDKDFRQQMNVIYTQYDSSTGEYELMLRAVSSGTSIELPSPVALSRFPELPNVKALNGSQQLVYPFISYSSSINTFKYDTIDVVTAGVMSWCNTTIPYMLKAFALDYTDNTSMYAVNDNALIKLKMASMTGSFNEITSLGDVVDVVFPGMAFGRTATDSLMACAIVNDDGSKSCIGFDALGNKIQLDSSQLIEKKVASSDIGSMFYENERYVLYGASENDGAFQLMFLRFGSIDNVSKIDGVNIPFNECVNDIARTGDSDVVALQTAHALYSCTVKKDNEHIDSILSSNDSQLGFLQSYETVDGFKYYLGSGSDVLSSNDLSTWSRIVNVSSFQDAHVNSFNSLSPYVILVSNISGAHAGLYYTFYDYIIEDNTSPFTAESAYYAYYSNISAIEEVYLNALSAHIDEHHFALNNEMQVLNSCMDTNFNLSGFLNAHSQNDVENDYIDRILAGGTDDDNIVVHASNSAIGSSWVHLKCKYLAKCWKSGLTELYVFLPTTNTYYIPHIEGASQCDGYDEEVIVNNRTLSSNIKDNFTRIRMNVSNARFNITTLAENTIKPSSLPLRVFKDAENADFGAAAMFHSFVCPSVAEEFSFDNSDLGYYTFNYYCFGSDAQSIKLTFFNDSPDYDRKFKTIVYHANGGTSTVFNGMTDIVQHVYEDAGNVSLQWNIFSKEGSFFTGWSQSSNAVDGDESYSASIVFNYSTMKQTRLDLYACWISYQFGASDTQITVSNTQPIDYTIAEITIDPNAQLQGNPSLGNKVIIDYGD